MKTDSEAVPRLRERLREEAARAILAAAEEVFGDQGLGARMEQVAARAGVAVGTLYNHFRDRDALLAAVQRSRREALLARVDAALEATAGEPVGTRLGAYLGALLDHGRTHGRFLGALVQAGEGPARTRPTGSLLGALVSRADAVLSAARRRGELRADPADVQALAFVGIARTVLLHGLESGRLDATLADAALDLFLSGARA